MSVAYGYMLGCNTNLNTKDLTQLYVKQWFILPPWLWLLLHYIYIGYIKMIYCLYIVYILIHTHTHTQTHTHTHTHTCLLLVLWAGRVVFGGRKCAQTPDRYSGCVVVL